MIGSTRTYKGELNMYYLSLEKLLSQNLDNRRTVSKGQCDLRTQRTTDGTGWILSQ